MALLTSLLLTLPSPALAGSGPWVVGERQSTLFVGVESQRLNKLAITAEGERSVIDVGEGLSSFVAKAIGTVGVGPRFELQGTVPYWRVQANRPNVPLCTALGAEAGREACETTTGLGILELRAKGLLVDEFVAGPFSLAVGAELRFGDFTTGTRDRLTNLGEGGLDTGGFVALGRTGPLGGSGYWSAFLELLGRYRFPLTRDFPPRLGDRSVPGSEFAAIGECVFSPGGRVAFGPSVSALWRPFGVDWGDLDLTDVDRLGALRVFNARAGGTFAVRGPKNLVATATILHTVWAINNPSNVLSIGAGVQAQLGPSRRAGRDG